MKRLTAWLLAISLLLACGSACAESMIDYNDAVSQMMEQFELREYQSVVEIYDEICAVWPDALDRGNIDNYAQYARGRVALEQHDYNKAILIFSTLGAFPSADDSLNAARLQVYCEAQRFLMFGLYEEALAKFRACDGILDSARMIELLTGEQQETLYGFHASNGSVAVELQWVDVATDTDEYYVTYMPKGVESYSRTVLTARQAVSLTDLIPRTTYVAYITPVRNATPSGLSQETEFTTGTPRKLDGLRNTEAALYEYKKSAKDNYLKKMSSDDDAVFLKAVIDVGKRKMMLANEYVWELEDAIPLSYGDMAFADNGFIFRGLWNTKTQPADTIRVVFRSENGENHNLVYYKDAPVSYIAGYFSTGFYLDDLLDEIYTNQNGWPIDTDLIIELYSGDALIYVTSYHLTME